MGVVPSAEFKFTNSILENHFSCERILAFTKEVFAILFLMFKIEISFECLSCCIGSKTIVPSGRNRSIVFQKQLLIELFSLILNPLETIDGLNHYY